MDESRVLYTSIPCNARTVATVTIRGLAQPHEASASYVLATLLFYLMRLANCTELRFSLLQRAVQFEPSRSLVAFGGSERVNTLETQVDGNQVAIASEESWWASNALAGTKGISGSRGLMATTAGGRATVGRPWMKRSGWAAYAASRAA